MKKPITPQPPKRRATRRAPDPLTANRNPSVERPFPIVGIGTSAGGLEALGRFFARVPAKCGMAFVVIQHLDPTQKGMLTELLQRTTSMKVVQVKDRTEVRPNCVYVIPPNKDMSLLQGTLHLLSPAAPRGLRLPIDFFFRSLADDQQERSVGIILSGMGSDGTLGLRAIKERAGVTLVQDPDTAKFDSMPRSAIRAGLGDFVAPVEELPARLKAFYECLPPVRSPDLPLAEHDQSSLEKIVILLRAHTRQDFNLYRRSTLYRRVERRMGIHRLNKISSYVRYLQENPQELDILFKELLIGVTRFFRDPPAWRILAKDVLPKLLSGRPARSVVRAWVAGCSSGEEAYTLAMIFAEALGEAKSTNGISLQIYATDLDKDAIDKARLSLFPENIVADVSPERLARFFVKEENGYRVNKQIRSMVVFAPQNLIMDPPFTKLDILCCRNLLIYLTPELQKKLFPLFHYSLNPGGVLFLGSAECIGGFIHLFVPIAQKERIFKRNGSTVAGQPLNFPAVFAPSPMTRREASVPGRRPGSNFQTQAERLVYDRFAPPAVLVDEQGDIVFFSGRTGQFLEPPAGKANLNVLAMAREGLRYELATALQTVSRKKDTVTVKNIMVGVGAKARTIDVVVQPLDEPKELRGMVLIVFSDSPPRTETGARGGSGKTRASPAPLRELQRQLLRARAEVQAAREEMQSSQEELKSLNEELQSTNEELQSSNEELTTSKEEMQSLNEELQTVNSELQIKLDELSGANSDMKNLLNSTDIATVFLDNELCLRRFTLQAKSIIKFIPTDVGRPFTDLASDLIYPGLIADAHEVLRTLVFSERSIATGDGRWFTVRIMPYRTMDNRIDGVVLTFANITAAKKVEAGLREKNTDLSAHSAKQGRALTRAEDRLAALEVQSPLKTTQQRPHSKATRTPGKHPS